MSEGLTNGIEVQEITMGGNRIKELLNINLSPLETQEFSDDEKRCLSELLSFISDPDKILSMPRLPYTYKPPGEGRRHKPPYKVKEKYHPQWYELDEPSVLDEWAISNGFESLRDVYEEVPLDHLLQVLQPIPKLRERIENARSDERKVFIRQVLEAIKITITSQIYAENVVKEGEELIKRHLPEFAPQQEYQVLAIPGHAPSQGENGEYLGKVDGKHIIYVVTPADPYFTIENKGKYEEKMPMFSTIGAHELIHQAHAETVNDEGIFQIAKGLPQSFVEENTRAKIVKKIKEIGQAIPKADFSSMEYAIIEGVATAAELYIAIKEIDRQRKLGNFEEAERFTRAVKERIRILRRAEKKGEGEHYSIGLKIIIKLYNKMTIDQVGEFLKNVDLKAARNIKKGSPEYDQIIKDPMLLPRLKAKKF